jgi:hypothetical protein
MLPKVTNLEFFALPTCQLISVSLTAFDAPECQTFRKSHDVKPELLNVPREVLLRDCPLLSRIFFWRIKDSSPTKES